MIDKKGNVFVWFTKSYQEWEAGDKFEIKGTVKKHDTYNDLKQTHLSRVKEI